MDYNKFFHPDINGSEAERLLMEKGEDGSFLTRRSQSDPGHFVLSVRNKDTIKHFKIRYDGETYDLFGGEKFANLSELIFYCKDKSNVLKEYRSDQRVKLEKALPTDSGIKERHYHGFLSGKQAQELLQDVSLKDGTYLVRSSYSKPGCLVLSYKVDATVKHTHIYQKNGSYSSGDGVEFSSLSDYIKSYGYLKYPKNSTKFRPSEIQRRISELEKQTDNTNKDGFGEEFKILLGSDNTTPYSRDEGRKECNKSKNRYKNILPFDYTRVILRDGDSSVEGSDYINANYITTKNCADTTKYIATQGCLENTVSDFWRMIWQENSHVIVMTTKEVERGKKKCARYWPEENESKTFDFFNGKLTVQLLRKVDTQHYVMRTLLAEFVERVNQTHQSRDIYQYHYKGWPDHGVPNDPGPTVDFLQDINKKQNDIPEAGPVIIHCSAGIGRTGTFIVIDTILKQIEKNGMDMDIDILNTVHKMRQQRPGLVQTVCQYKFVYLAIAHYLEARSKRLDTNQAQYVNASGVVGFRSSGKPIPAKPSRKSATKLDKERSQQEAGKSVYENFSMVLPTGTSSKITMA